jgi:hypothetical protein
MSARSERERALLVKIRDLSDGRVAEVEDFVEVLRSSDEAETPHKRNAGTRLDRVYEQDVKPVEQVHLGEYVLVTPDGEMYLAPTQSELVLKTAHIRGGDNCLFKVGEIAATKIL